MLPLNYWDEYLSSFLSTPFHHFHPSIRIDFPVKKEGWGGGGTRQIRFLQGQSNEAVLKVSGKALTVSIGSGMARNSRKSNISHPL